MNHWLLKKKFSEGRLVRVKMTGDSVLPELAGRIGEVTNVFPKSDWIGVYFGGGNKWISGKTWNVFFPEDLELHDELSQEDGSGQ